jgi:hypothetical protein
MIISGCVIDVWLRDVILGGSSVELLTDRQHHAVSNLDTMRGLAVVVAMGLCGTSQASEYDPRRVNPPVVPFAFEPLQWGAVTPGGLCPMHHSDVNTTICGTMSLA